MAPQTTDDRNQSVDQPVELKHVSTSLSILLLQSMRHDTNAAHLTIVDEIQHNVNHGLGAGVVQVYAPVSCHDPHESFVVDRCGQLQPEDQPTHRATGTTV